MKTNSVRPRYLFPFSLLLIACTTLLILAGGLVTSHEAGLAVPDWPLSYGQMMPPMVGNVFWEHGHRMIAGTVGMLTLIFAVAAQLKADSVKIKKLAWTAAGAVVLQALLGGLTVILMLPPPVSIVHACLAQIFYCITVALAFNLSNYSPADKTEDDARILRLSRLTFIFIFVQLVLGATVRHTGRGIVFHVIMAFIVFVHVALIVSRVMRSGTADLWLVRPALALGTLTVFQVFLGIGAFVFTQMLERSYAPARGEVIFTAAHQTTGAVILALTALLWLVSRRRNL